MTKSNNSKKSKIEFVLNDYEIRLVKDHYEQYLKDHHDKDSYEPDKSVKNLYDKLTVGKLYINKQWDAKKKLQKGLLSEYVYAQTFALMLGLQSVYDCEKNDYAKFLKGIYNQNIRVYIEHFSPKYIYFDKKIDFIMFHFGNKRGACDLLLISKNKSWKIKVSKNNITLGETQLTYNDEGCLEIRDPENSPHSSYFEDYIVDFNEQNSVFDFVRLDGTSNYKLPVDSIKLSDVAALFNDFDYDLWITQEQKTNNMVVIDCKNFEKYFSEDDSLLDLKGSEIRFTGKNCDSLFTPKYFYEFIDTCEGINRDDEFIVIDDSWDNWKSTYGKKTQSNKETTKLGSVFKAKNRSAEYDTNAVRIHEQFINQNIPAISFHLKVNAKQDKESIFSILNKDDTYLNDVYVDSILDNDTDGITTRTEGKRVKVYSTKYERDPKNRQIAIDENRQRNNGKLICDICGFDFYDKYGKRGLDYMQVHHKKPLHEGEREVDPREDLCAICANCHAMIHRYKDNTLTIEELKKMIKYESFD